METMKERVLSYLYGGLKPTEVADFRTELESNAELAACLAAKEAGLHARLPVGDGAADLLESVLNERRLLLRAALRREVREPLSAHGRLQLWFGGVAPRLAWAGGGVALLLCGVLLGRGLPGESSVMAAALTADTLVDVRVTNYDETKGQIEFELVGLATSRMAGELKDPRIQAMLTAAMLGDLEPGSRLLAVDLLRHQTASANIRQALTEALLN